MNSMLRAKWKILCERLPPRPRFLLRVIVDAGILFQHQGGFTSAAAATFYFVISIIPLLLLLLRLVGVLLGDVVQTHAQFFILAEHFFPDVSPEVIIKVRELIAGPLLGAKSFTVINGVLLLFSSLSFLNAIWDGLSMMTGAKHHAESHQKYIKGIFLVGITIMLMTLTFLAIPTIILIIKFVQTASVVSFMWEYLAPIRPLIDALRSFNWEANDVFSSNYFYGPIFVAYFTFLYRWFFSWKISFKEALAGAASFVLMLLAWKSLFLLYFMHVRENLMRNYGDYYTVIAALIWIDMVMCFFFFGAGLCYTLNQAQSNDRRESFDTNVD